MPLVEVGKGRMQPRPRGAGPRPRVQLNDIVAVGDQVRHDDGLAVLNRVVGDSAGGEEPLNAVWGRADSSMSVKPALRG